MKPKHLLAAIFPLLSAFSAVTGSGQNQDPLIQSIEATPNESLVLAGINNFSVAVWVAKEMQWGGPHDISKQPFTSDEVKFAIRSLVREIDSRKIFFLNSDIDYIETLLSSNIPETFGSGDGFLKELNTITFKIASLLIGRAQAAEPALNELIKSELNRSDEEFLDLAADAFPVDQAAGIDNARKHLELFVLRRLAAGETGIEKIKQDFLEQLISELNWMWATPEHIQQRVMAHLFEADQPLSNLYTEDSYVDSDRWSKLRISGPSYRLRNGIGVELKTTGPAVVVSKVYAGSPADKSGKFKVGTLIKSVGKDCRDEELIPVTGKPISEVERLLRSNTQWDAKIVVENAGVTSTLCVNRGMQMHPDERVQGRIVSSSSHGNLKFGYMSVPGFYRTNILAEPNAESEWDFSSYADAKSVLDNLNQNGADVLILDLRKTYSTDPGGKFRDGSELMRFASLFLKDGSYFQAESSNSMHPDRMDILRAPKNLEFSLWTKPIVVLVSKDTWSDLESLAHLLKAYGRAIVAGDEHTAGDGYEMRYISQKGLAAMGSYASSTRNGPVEIPTDGWLARYITQDAVRYAVDGTTVAVKGLQSDVQIPSITGILTHTLADEPRAPSVPPSIPGVRYSPYDLRSQRILDEVAKASAERIALSRAFAETHEAAQTFAAKEGMTQLPLRETDYQAYAADLTNAKARVEERSVYYSRDAFGQPENFVSNEVFAIASDYLRLLGN